MIGVFFALIILLICFCSPVFSGGSKVYTDQDLGQYGAGTSENVSQDNESPPKKTETLGDIQKEAAFRSQLAALNYRTGVAKDAGRFSVMIKAMQERDELKVKVIDTYGSLPSWWKEE